MLSEVLFLTLLAANPTVPVDASTSADSAQAPTTQSGPVCSADSRRARRAAAAEEVRLHRDALKVTRETLSHAANILASRTDGVIERWQAEFRREARIRLASTRDRNRVMLGLPTPALCSALAARDGAACQRLDDPAERGPCSVWTAVAGSEAGDETSCASLPEPARSICALAKTGDPKTCDRTPKAHRGFCESAARSLNGGQAGCSEPFQPQRCTWALLLSALRKGKQACSSGGSDVAGVVRATRFCEAAIQGETSSCPTDGRPKWATSEGTRSLQREEAFRVEKGETGPVGWVALMTSGPAACSVELTSEDGAPPAYGAAILSTLIDVLIPVGPLAPSKSARALSSVCAPTFDWRAQAAP